MLKLLAFVACLAYVAAENVEIENCLPEGENSHVSGVSMTVTDCHNPERCDLIRNTTHWIAITFVPNEDTTGLFMYVYGRVLRVRVPYVRNASLCVNTTSSDGTTCLENNGLKAGKTYTLQYPFYIRSQFPEWKVPVEFELWTTTAKMNCIRVQVEIKCNVNTEAGCAARTAASK